MVAKLVVRLPLVAALLLVSTTITNVLSSMVHQQNFIYPVPYKNYIGIITITITIYRFFKLFFFKFAAEKQRKKIEEEEEN